MVTRKPPFEKQEHWLFLHIRVNQSAAIISTGFRLGDAKKPIWRYHRLSARRRYSEPD
jgi:hypothetical protein